MVLLEVVAAVAVALLTLLAAVGVLPRNRVAGIRVRATTASDAAWRRGHRAALVPTLPSCAVVVVGGVVCAATGHADDVVVVLASAAVLLVGAVLGAAAANRDA